MSLTISSVAAELEDLPLSANKTDMATIVKVMQLPDSGLEIRDRMWLKITIANAVIGEDRATESAQFMQKAHIFVTGCLQLDCIIVNKPYL